MAMPNDEQLKAIETETKKLMNMSDTAVIMLALSEIVFYLPAIPVGKQLPLHAALKSKVLGRNGDDNL